MHRFPEREVEDTFGQAPFAQLEQDRGLAPEGSSSAGAGRSAENGMPERCLGGHEAASILSFVASCTAPYKGGRCPNGLGIGIKIDRGQDGMDHRTEAAGALSRFLWAGDLDEDIRLSRNNSAGFAIRAAGAT